MKCEGYHFQGGGGGGGGGGACGHYRHVSMAWRNRFQCDNMAPPYYNIGHQRQEMIVCSLCSLLATVKFVNHVLV